MSAAVPASESPDSFSDPVANFTGAPAANSTSELTTGSSSSHTDLHIATSQAFNQAGAPPVPANAAPAGPVSSSSSTADAGAGGSLGSESGATTLPGGLPNGSGDANTAALAQAVVAAPAVLRRKLTSFVGFSNLPQQWHQKAIRQGFDLNLLVVGDSGLGKSTLLNTLFEVPVHDLDAPHSYDGSTIGIQTTKILLEESGVKLRLSVIDTPGYGDHVNNLDTWKPIVDEVESRFDQYLESEESFSTSSSTAENPNTTTTAPDPRVHACLFFIEPTGHSLKPLDVAVMKKLHRKVNIVPIIAKADTQTDEELDRFKRAMLQDIRSQGIEIFEPPAYENDDEESSAELSDLKAKIPFAVIGSTQLVTNREGRSVLGREYPWGVVEVQNEEHNDFIKLRSLLIRNHMEDLRERTTQLYENYRTEKMVQLGIKQDDSVFNQPDPAVRLQEERRQHEQRLAKMEAEMRAVFQQKVTEKETKLKNSEAELFQKHREIKEQLDRQRQELEQRKQQLQLQLESKGHKSMMR